MTGRTRGREGVVLVELDSKPPPSLSPTAPPHTLDRTRFNRREMIPGSRWYGSSNYCQLRLDEGGCGRARLPSEITRQVGNGVNVPPRLCKGKLRSYKSFFFLSHCYAHNTPLFASYIIYFCENVSRVSDAKDTFLTRALAKSQVFVFVSRVLTRANILHFTAGPGATRLFTHYIFIN